VKCADFRLQDFTRMQWAPGAREVWEPRFRAVSNMSQDLEILLVARGLKTGALLVVPPEKLPSLSRTVNDHGLSLVILGQQGRNGQPYASTSEAYVEGRPFDYRVAVCTPTVATVWLNAWETSDNDAIGILLGYPECCRKFFQTTWVEKDLVDTTWAQAKNGNEPDLYDVINVSPDPACNVTLRHLGLRWVSHLPCSFHCQSTIDYVDSIRPVIKEFYPEEHRTLTEALLWPVKWSALHGIAEIVTPVCRIISRTDATLVKYTVHQHGALYPAEGARGTEFPFKVVEHQRIMFQKKNTWSLNGFSSYDAMIKAHNTVIHAAGDMKGKTIIDLGCGTGQLLRVYRGIASELHGVDINPAAIAAAIPDMNVRTLNIFDPAVFERDFDVAFISVQRFEENPEGAEILLTNLMTRTKEVVFYSYSDSTTGWEWVPKAPSIVNGNASATKVVW